MVDEQKEGEQTPEEQPEVKQEEQTPPAEPESSVGEVDDKGVSYKNRYAESERKREQLAEQMEEMTFKMNNLEQKITPPQQPVAQKQESSKNDMDEMIALGPKAYNQKLQQEFMYQQKLFDAENLIKEKFGAGRVQFGVSKVLDYGRKNMIDMQSDPVAAVSKILSEMEKPKMKTSAEDRKKTAEAIKNKPEGGKRPPAPPTNKSSDLMKNVHERGSIEDVAAALAEQWKQENK